MLHQDLLQQSVEVNQILHQLHMQRLAEEAIILLVIIMQQSAVVVQISHVLVIQRLVVDTLIRLLEYIAESYPGVEIVQLEIHQLLSEVGVILQVAVGQLLVEDIVIR